jgi:hypothetical protein
MSIIRCFAKCLATRRVRGSTRVQWPIWRRALPQPSGPTPSSRGSVPTTTTSERRFNRSTTSRISSRESPPDPDVSADAIMAHVVEGVRILREGGIPEPVVEFAYTHHGTSVIEYFWHKCLEAGNPKGLSDGAFRYPGMRPRTKETAILMLIDAIEAAARSVEEPTREKFEGVVQRVTNVKLRQGQLDESGLTLEDLRVLQSTLIDTLCNAYHNRIKYPWQDEKGEGQPALPVPGVATERDVARERSREST